MQSSAAFSTLSLRGSRCRCCTLSNPILTIRVRYNGTYRRSDFTNQPFTGIYDAGAPTAGPLGDASIYSTRITPKILKQHLDQFVVGQDRAKKVLSVAVYNHYQRIQELQRRDEEENELLAQQARREMAQRHPVEAEFPGQQSTIPLYPSEQAASRRDELPLYHSSRPVGSSPIFDTTPLTLEKSNILLLGPSGVGKTLMAKTLARVLEVPFSMSDCTPFTQAGYIGEDAEVCIARLLSAANYDVAKAEHGIVCLDEVDKIAKREVPNGKDVSGEGVQQALLKIVEGTTVQVQAKAERGSGTSGRGSASTSGPSNYSATGGPVGGPGSGMSPAQPSGGGKNEVFNVRTDNILFICTGAFIGLHKMILERISRGGIGFGASVRAKSTESSASHDTMLQADDEDLFRQHLPFYQTAPHGVESHPTAATFASDSQQNGFEEEPHKHNALDLTTPADLQKFGLIPELVGRLPITCAVSPLSVNSLVRVLTEPRNSLVRQYEQLLALSGVELRFTTPALRVIAEVAEKMGIGARGLRTVLEGLLGEVQFDVPGSLYKFVLITEAVARKQIAPVYLIKGEKHRFHALIAAEEEAWEARQRGIVIDGPDGGGTDESEGSRSYSFEEYRQKVNSTGYV